MTTKTNKPLAPYTRKQLEAMARVKQARAAKAKLVPTVQIAETSLNEITYQVECIKKAVQSGLEHDKNQATALAWLAVGVIVNLVVQSYYLYELVTKH